MTQHETKRLVSRDVHGNRLTIGRADDRWLVDWADCHLEGRTLAPLLERLFGPRDREVVPLTLDALERRWAADAPLARDSDADE